MIAKQPFRPSLLALAGGLLLGVLVSIPVFARKPA